MTRGLLNGMGMLAALIALSGCEVTVVPFCDDYPDDPSCRAWNPSGDEISIGTSGPWTINGVDADATNCAAAGIGFVEVRLFENMTGSDYYTTPAFRVACSAAAFDTRPNRVLRRDRYFSQWFALSPAGVEIGAMTDRLIFDTSALNVGDHAQLLAPDYIVNVNPTLVGNLQFELPDLSSAGDCTAAGVTTMTYTLNDGASGVYDMMSDIACGTQITWENIPADTYSLYVEGTSIGGTKDWMGTCGGITVAATGMSAFDCIVDYVGVPPTPTLHIDLGWDTDPGPTMSDGTCAVAGVAVMSYQLKVTGASTNTSEEYDVTCADALDFTDLAPGTYDLYVEGGTVAMKAWMSMSCNMYVYDGGVDMYNCAVDRTM